MKNIKTQQGFTLIELVVVIVILGILAATAAPKFINLTGDAKSSVVKAVEGALNSASDIAHAKALVNNIVDGDLSVAGQNITFADTYPNNASINLLMDVESDDFDIETSAGSTTYSYKGVTVASTCQASYTETSDPNVKPVIDSTTTGC